VAPPPQRATCCIDRSKSKAGKQSRTSHRVLLAESKHKGTGGAGLQGLRKRGQINCRVAHLSRTLRKTCPERSRRVGFHTCKPSGIFTRPCHCHPEAAESPAKRTTPNEGPMQLRRRRHCSCGTDTPVRCL